MSVLFTVPIAARSGQPVGGRPSRGGWRDGLRRTRNSARAESGDPASARAYASLCVARMAGVPARRTRAIGSSGERLGHTEEVPRSIPVSPTEILAGQRPDAGPRRLLLAGSCPILGARREAILAGSVP